MRDKFRAGLHQARDAAVALALIGGVASALGFSHDTRAGATASHRPGADQFDQTSPAAGGDSEGRNAKSGSPWRGFDLTDDLQTRNGLSSSRFAAAPQARSASGRPGLADARDGLRDPAAPAAPGVADGRCPVVSARLGLHWPYSPYPENSAGAIDAAHRAGAPKVEIDVAFSRDGVPVVLHDATIDRVTGHPGNVSSYTAARLESFRLKLGDQRMSDQHLLSLWDALTRVKADGMRVSVEVKPDVLTLGQARAIDENLARLNYWHMLDVRSFDEPVLALMRRIDPRIHTTLIVHRPVVPAPPGNVMESIAYRWHGSTLQPAVVSALHAKGYQVDAFTPDTKAGFAAVPQTVDQITTNNVAGARAYLKARGC